MPDSDLQLTLSADASGVVQGVGEAKSAIAGLAPQVDAVAKSFGGLASHAKEGVDGLANALKQAAAGGVAADQQRASSHAQANAQISQGDSGATAAFAANQAQQVAAAEDADRAKVASNVAANQKIAAASDQALKQLQSSMTRLASTFATGFARMAMGAESFGKLMRQVGQQILTDIFRVVAGMVEKWAWGETERVLASQEGQALLRALGLADLAQQVANDITKTRSAVGSAAQQRSAASAVRAAGLAQDAAASTAERAMNAQNAFSGAIAAISPIPFVGPFLAPGIAAEMAALASAAGGYDIPAGVNPLTQLHAQEMVLPARLANPMRDMLASFGSGGAPASAGHSFSFGDTHIHGAPNMSPADFRQALAEHRASVAEAVANALHSGWRPSYRQPVGAL